MRKVFGFLAGGALLASVAVIVQSAAQPAPAAAPETTSASQDADLTRGAKAWANHCSRCHNLRSPSELDAALWDVSVTHMRVRANLPGDLADDIKAFLMSSAESKTSNPSGESAPADAYAHLKPGDAERGREIYSQTCVACHGADGTGAIEGIPDFTIAGGRLSKSDGVLLADMINGFQSEGSLMAMPPKGGNPDLTDQDLADTLAYMRKAFWKGPEAHK